MDDYGQEQQDNIAEEGRFKNANTDWIYKEDKEHGEKMFRHFEILGHKSNALEKQ